MATIGAAKTAGVGHITVQSVSTAGVVSTLFGRQFHTIERATIASGLPYTILRLPLFTDNIWCVGSLHASLCVPVCVPVCVPAYCRIFPWACCANRSLFYCLIVPYPMRASGVSRSPSRPRASSTTP